jgi:DNA-binding transcriptional regulator YhcF (GntR family)
LSSPLEEFPMIAEDLKDARAEVLKLLPKASPIPTVRVMARMRDQGIDENVIRMAIVRLAETGYVYPMSRGRIRRGSGDKSVKKSTTNLLAM